MRLKTVSINKRRLYYNQDANLASQNFVSKRQSGLPPNYQEAIIHSDRKSQSITVDINKAISKRRSGMDT